MFRFLLLIELVLSVGCSRWHVRTEIKTFQKTAIQIPIDMEVIQNGMLLDSIFPIRSYKIKFVIYFSSKGCASCNINHLNDLDTLFKLKQDYLFSPIVIFTPDAKKYTELLQNLKIQGYLFPICIDKNNEFQQSNKNLPADTRFHSFLLDKNNKVVLVGNPLASDAMWSLFKSTLDNMLAHDGVYVPEK